MVAIHRFGFGTSFEPPHITKDYLGGKGFGLVMMGKAGIPVPPGLIIPTHVSQNYMQLQGPAKTEAVTGVVEQVLEHLNELKDYTGYMPLLSVRSGAPISMPGMMDTILNVGLTVANMPEWHQRVGWFTAMDSYRRLIQMLGSTAFGVPHDKFEHQLALAKEKAGVTEDKDLASDELAGLIDQYKKLFQAVVQSEFPETLEMQLFHAIRAVFESWSNPRAVAYRKMNDIPDDMGTAIVIQSMVFGNMGEDSGTGVLFSRCPLSGENKILGEFLPNAQGEDVVAGIRTPLPFDKMDKMDGEYAEHWSVIHAELEELCNELEEHLYSDMVDIEFTVQKGKLFVLQSRVGKRSALSAFVIARDLVTEGIITQDEAFNRLTRDQLKILSRPMIPANFDVPAHAQGIPASPGVAKGTVVFKSQAAMDMAANGTQVILMSKETTPDDIGGMNAAQGILTLMGGATSHAAVVARAMDKPCVVGCAEIKMNGKNSFICGSAKIVEGSMLTIDGATGRVWVDAEVPVVDASKHSAISTFLDWAHSNATDAAIDVVEAPIPEANCSYAVEAARILAAPNFEEQVIHLCKALTNGHLVLLDATPRHEWYDADDDQLSGSFGTPKQVLDRLTALYQVLGGLPLAAKQNLLVINPGGLHELIGSHGLTCVGPAKTLNDYLHSPYTVMDENFIQNVLGGADMVNLLEDLCETKGVKKTQVPKTIQRRHALFNRLKA